MISGEHLPEYMVGEPGKAMRSAFDLLGMLEPVKEAKRQYIEEHPKATSLEVTNYLRSRFREGPALIERLAEDLIDYDYEHFAFRKVGRQGAV